MRKGSEQAAGSKMPPLRALEDDCRSNVQLVDGYAMARLGRAEGEDVTDEPFDPGAIDVRCEITHGEQDTVAPVANGEHNATLIPNATLTRLPEHGHLSNLTEIPRLATRLTTPQMAQ